MSALTFLDLPQRLRLLLLTEPPRAVDSIPLCRSSLALGIPQFKSVNRRTRGGVALHPLLEQVLQRMAGEPVLHRTIDLGFELIVRATSAVL